MIVIKPYMKRTSEDLPELIECRETGGCLLAES